MQLNGIVCAMSHDVEFSCPCDVSLLNTGPVRGAAACKLHATFNSMQCLMNGLPGSKQCMTVAADDCTEWAYQNSKVESLGFRSPGPLAI